jgi:hypothetical protein
MRRQFSRVVILYLGFSMALAAAAEKSFDAAAAFGARPSVSDLSLSPDGANIAYVSPMAGAGSGLYTLSLQPGAKPRVALAADGKPMQLGSCQWVSNTRLVCNVYGVVDNKSVVGLLPFTRLVAVDADGKNFKLLSKKENEYARGLQLGGGEVIDALPDQDGTVLTTRVYLPNDHTGSLIGSSAEGLGVDRVDTRTLAAVNVEPPSKGAVEYLSDGAGSVRIMGLRVINNARRQDNGITTFMYRMRTSREWHKLGEYNSVDRSGFWPLAVDPTHDVAYGLKKADGRLAMYSVALDGSLHEELIFQRPDVDVNSLVRIGRRQRAVGIQYTDEKGRGQYFDPEIERMHMTLAKALPTLPIIGIVDSSVDESKLLVFAASDNNPGVYYLFDRKARPLRDRDLAGPRPPTRGLRRPHPDAPQERRVFAAVAGNVKPRHRPEKAAAAPNSVLLAPLAQSFQQS